jgi:hypothetical protein
MGEVIGTLTGFLAVLLIFGGIPAALVVAYSFSRKARHAERLAMIEKGVDPSTFMHEEASSDTALMWGMLILGVGLGLFLGYILSVLTSMSQEYLMPALALIFGGLGLVGFFIYRNKSEAKKAA